MKKILLIAACLSLKLCVFGASSPACAEDDILINDFEAPDYGDWRAEGEAFGERPAVANVTPPNQVTGHQGKGLVNTFLGGDAPVGAAAPRGADCPAGGAARGRGARRAQFRFHDRPAA